ncbi:hypothetical protein CK910_22860 [Aeromonas sp. CA23]|uniref:OmpA family protein n=1 Tax=Aeromonas sp. CA23 TaxID=2033032 RepID=UPI000BFD14D2|nr:OmpA family protein [Aeromonas sp. CA23]ATM01002.1 hypothetical protein CK910_22860 [Aeromonas sp. CA23]
MKRMTVIVLAALGTHNVSYAGEDVYIGAGAGFTHFHGLNKIEGVTAGTEDAAAANAFVGYNLNDYLGAELGYVYAGRGNTDGNRFENQGGTLSLIGRVPLIGDLSLFGEAGGYWAHTDGLGTKDTKVSSLFGAGLTYPVSESFDVQARWRYMSDVSDLHSTSPDARMKMNQNMTTLEVVYHPFRGESASVPVEAPVVIHQPVPVEKTFQLSSDVLFSFGKSDLKPEGIIELGKMYEQLIAIQPKDGKAIVIGYSDRIGSDAVNQRISRERAEAVASFLVSKGFPSGKIKTEGHGATNSITGSECDGLTSKAKQVSCLAPDRRVEVSVTGVVDEK